MATITRIFRRFSTSVIESPSKSFTKLPIKSIRADLFNEQNFKTVAENFKTWSQLPLFRRKASFYYKTVGRFTSAKKFELVEEILEHQKQYDDISEEWFATRLITLYGKSAMFDHASKVFDEMPDRKCPHTVTSFNVLLDACVNAKAFHKVDGLFRDLPGKISVKPDVVSYNTVIKGFCEMGSLDSAASVLDEIEKNGLQPSLVTFNTLLFGFYNNGRFLDGENYWAKLMNTGISPDIRTYNARLVGLVSENKIDEAVELFNQLSSIELKPSEFTYNAIINGFCKDGNLQEAKNWYSKLMESDSAPNGATFPPLIRLACKTSDLDWAVELFKQTFEQKCRVNSNLMQHVIDELVKVSKTEEAKQLVVIGNSNKFRPYNLTMPAA